MKPSKPMSLNALDYKKIAKDALIFFSVPLIFYFTAILGTIQTEGHIFSLSDFIPSNATIIAIVAWLLNSVVNIIKKFVA